MSEIRANSITDAAGTGAPNFPNGLELAGAPLNTPGTQTFTAGGNITAGDPIAINADGSVSSVGLMNGVDDASFLLKSTVGSYSGSNYVLNNPTNNGAADGFGFIKISDTEFVVSMWDPSALSLSASIVTVQADGTTTFGAKVVGVASGVTNPFYAFKIASDRFAIIYQTATTNSLVVIGQVSGSTITFGSPATIHTGVSLNGIICASNGSGGILVAQNTSATNQPLRIVAISTSGTTATVGGITTLKSTSPAYVFPTLGYDPVGDVFLLNVCDVSASTFVWSYGIKVSGSTITAFSGPTNVFGQSLAGANSSFVVYDPSISRFVVVVTFASSGVNRVHTATISGTTVTASAQSTNFVGNSGVLWFSFDGSLVLFASSANKLTFDPLNSYKPSGTVLPHLPLPQIKQTGSLGNGFYVYCENTVISGGYQPTVNLYGLSSLSRFLGVANETVTLGQPVNAAVSGGICTSLSGLSPSLRHYIQPLGNIATTPTTKGYIGTALSSTSLLVGPDFGDQ
jgi:hypothetical protein